MKNILSLTTTSILLVACGEAATTTKVSEGVSAVKGAVEYVAPDALPAKLEGAATGTYSLEKTHAFLTASLSHGGLSDYKLDFTDIDSTVVFDPSDLGAMSVAFTVNPASVATHYAGDYMRGHSKSGFKSWDEDLGFNTKYLNANAFPEVSFASTSIKRMGDYEADVMGELTFLGVTKPMTFDVTYNGVGNKPWYGERDLIGFNATGTFNRSDFGLSAMVPNIGDEVTISFTGEFLQDAE